MNYHANVNEKKEENKAHLYGGLNRVLSDPPRNYQQGFYDTHLRN